MTLAKKMGQVPADGDGDPVTRAGPAEKGP